MSQTLKFLGLQLLIFSSLTAFAQNKKEKISELNEQLISANLKIILLEKKYDSINKYADSNLKLMTGLLAKASKRINSDSILICQQLSILKFMQNSYDSIKYSLANNYEVDSLQYELYKSESKLFTDSIDPIFIYNGYAIISNKYDSSWIIPNSYEIISEGQVKCQININALPKYLRDFLHSNYTIYGDGRILGAARINKIYLLANSVPHSGNLQFWDKTVTSVTDNPEINSEEAKAKYFFQYAGQAGTYLVGEVLSADSLVLKSDFLLLSKRLNNHRYKLLPSENQTLKKLKTEISNIFENSLVALIKDDYISCTSLKYSLWLKNPKCEQKWNYFDAGNNEYFIFFSTRILDDLNTECISVTSLWRCENGRKPTLIWHDKAYYTFLSITNLDNDLMPEFIIDRGSFSPEIYFLKNDDNSSTLWKMIPLYFVPYRDCPM